MILLQLALSIGSSGDSRKAIEVYEQGLTISRETGRRRREGVALMGIATEYYALSQYTRVLDLGGKALAISRELGHQDVEKIVCEVLATSFARLGNIEEAWGYLKRAEEIGGEVSCHHWHVLEAQVKHSTDRGHLEEAARWAARAMDRALEMDDTDYNTRFAEHLLQTRIQQTQQALRDQKSEETPEITAKILEPAAHLPDATVATQLLQRLVLPLLIEQGPKARAAVVEVLQQVATWGRPEISRRLTPAAAALECADEDAWQAKRGTLPPGEREAAQAVRDTMLAGHELSVASELLKQGDAQQALSAADRFLDAHPGDPRGLDLALAACDKLGDREAARARLDRSIEQAPKSAELRRTAVQVSLHLDLHPEALEHAGELVRLVPEDPKAHALLALRLLKQDRAVEAESAFARAVELDPDHKMPGYRIELAEACLINSHADAAAGALAAFEPGEAEPRYHAVFHWLRVYAAAESGDRQATRREVSRFVTYWSTVPTEMRVDWDFSDLLQVAGRLPEWAQTLVRRMSEVLAGTRPLAPFALAHGEEKGVERVLLAMADTGKTGLRLLESGLVASLADVRLHTGRRAAMEAFFEALQERYGEMAQPAIGVADALLLEAMTTGEVHEKRLALRVAGAHLLHFEDETRARVLQAMLGRADDAGEAPQVRDLAVRILAIVFYDLTEDQQAEVEARLRAVSASFCPPALVDFLSEL